MVEGIDPQRRYFILRVKRDDVGCGMSVEGRKPSQENETTEISCIDVIPCVSHPGKRVGTLRHYVRSSAGSSRPDLEQDP